MTGSLPSGFSVQMSQPYVYAIRVPSGDQAGSSTPENGVGTATGFPPSASIIQSDGMPVRSLTKAILVPSGDQVGSLSQLVLVVNRWRSVPSGLTVYSS